MEQLIGMGFPPIRCQKALLATGNEDPNAAMEWLFGHMDDPGQNTFLFLEHSCRHTDHPLCLDIDDPIVLQTSGGASAATAGPEPSEDQIQALSEMGFTSGQARKALRETVSL